MFRGRKRAHRLVAICFVGVIFLIGVAGLSFASLPPTETGSQTFFLPLCPSNNSLESQLTSPKEGEPNVTFSLGKRYPIFLTSAQNPGGANVESLDKNSPQMTAKFVFSPASELRVSFLYNQDQPPGQSPIGPASQLLFRYSVDFCIMPTLKVGMSGYLYKPASDYFSWRSNLNFSDPVFGVGPGVKYDLGRWSILLRSQLEPGTKDRSDALHNWFRVWYAF